MAARTGTSLPRGDDAKISSLAGASIADVVLGSRRPGELTLALAVTVAAAVVYLLSAPPTQPLAYFVPLADAFLHGRLYVTEAPSWLSELVPAAVGWYVPYPPMPAVVLLPFVALFGPELPQQVISSVAGAASVGLLFLAIGRLGVHGRTRLGLIAVFAFGTVLWWGASEGSAWLSRRPSPSSSARPPFSLRRTGAPRSSSASSWVARRSHGFQSG
jgi:hypothetical protein